MTPALATSIAAVLFTVGSFWWLWAYRGKVIGHPVGSYAAALQSGDILLRLPIVLSNTGARGRVVVDARIRLGNGPAESFLKWQTTRKSLKPTEDDVEDFAVVFTLGNRASERRFMEFAGKLAEVVPQPCDYEYRLELMLDQQHGWQTVSHGVLRLGHLVHPANYIVYANSAEPCTQDEVDRARKALLEYAERSGIVPTWS